MSRYNKILSLIFFYSFLPGITFAETSVGVIVPLTGEAGSYGKACVNGITLAQEDFATKLEGNVKFYTEDDQNTPSKTLSAFRNIQQRAGAKIILTWASNTSKVIAPIADRENFISFAVASDPEISKGKKNVFQYWVTPEEEARALLKELHRRNIKKVAIISAIQEGASLNEAVFH